MNDAEQAYSLGFDDGLLFYVGMPPLHEGSSATINNSSEYYKGFDDGMESARLSLGYKRWSVSSIIKTSLRVFGNSVIRFLDWRRKKIDES